LFATVAKPFFRVKKILKGAAILLSLFLAGFFLAGIIQPTCEDALRIQINAPLEKIFTLATDPAKASLWMTNLKRIEPVSGTPNAVGAKSNFVFDENGKEIVMLQTVTAYRVNEVFASKLQNDFASFDFEMSFREEGGKTLISEHNTGKGNSPISRPLLAIMKSSVKKQRRELYSNLKKLLESC